MYKKILGILITISALLALGYFLNWYFDKSNNEITRTLYNPFQNVTLPSADLAEQTCTDFETKEFAFYLNDSLYFETNNKFGIYIYAERQDFFEKAAELVNSNGGSWGYVLIPYNIKDRDSKRWQRAFDDLNRLKLIPVIQLWDVNPDKYETQTRQAAQFLDSFDWPIKPRYISVYNEVNDKRFWNGKIDPKRYAEVLDFTIDTFKLENKDYQIMNGAFNVSAGNTRETVDSFYYMKKMNEAIPGIFDKLDAWAAHPYPQPNFSGHPLTTGRWSIRAYEDELNFLKNNLGLKKDLPVFITETGWAHKENAGTDKNFLSEETVAEYFKYAYEQIWLKDPKVRAVMPFTIKYNPPFDHFSWVKEDYKSTYKQFDVIKSLPKIAGKPSNLVKGSYKVAKCN
jgi:hypothetical protein